MSNTRMQAGVLLVVAALAAGCRSDSSTGPKPTLTAPKLDTLDLGTIFSQMLIGDVNAFPAFSELMLSSTLRTVPPAIVPSTCSYSASAGGFTCSPTTVFSANSVTEFTFKVSYSLYDTAGHAQSAPDANTTAAVRLVIDVTGDPAVFSGANVGTDVVTDHEDMTLSGLLTPTRILNGTGTWHQDYKLTSPFNTDHQVSDRETTTAMVVLKPPGTGGPVGPTSGTITSNLTVADTLTPCCTVLSDTHGAITFDGSGLATFVQTGPKYGRPEIATRCTIDLSGASQTECLEIIETQRASGLRNRDSGIVGTRQLPIPTIPGSRPIRTVTPEWDRRARP